MNTEKGYYSILQYCPDQSRLEAVNIGLVLFCPAINLLKSRWMVTRHSRIKKVFGEQDWVFIENHIDAVGERLVSPSTFKGRDEFVRYSETRSNALRLTQPRAVQVGNDPERTLNGMFDILVGEVRRVQRAPKMGQALRKAFSDSNVLGLVNENIQVKIPKLNKTLKASYGYQNGRYNLVQPEQFALADIEQVFDKASRVATEGRFIFDERDHKLGPMRLVVVGKFRAGEFGAREIVQEIFEKNQVTLYDFGAMEPLIQDIKKNSAKHDKDRPLLH